MSNQAVDPLRLNSPIIQLEGGKPSQRNLFTKANVNFTLGQGKEALPLNGSLNADLNEFSAY